MKDYKNTLLSIVVIPMYDIIINIFRLLQHSPTCQRGLRFDSVVQSRLSSAGIIDKNRQTYLRARREHYRNSIL